MTIATKGRRVHYVSYDQTFPDDQCRAAVCTVATVMPDMNVPEGSEHICLMVLDLWQTDPKHNIPHDEDTKAPGTWHYPEDTAIAGA